MASIGKLKAGAHPSECQRTVVRHAGPEGAPAGTPGASRPVGHPGCGLDRRRRRRHPGDRRSVRPVQALRGGDRGTGSPEGNRSRRLQPQYDGRPCPLLHGGRSFAATAAVSWTSRSPAGPTGTSRAGVWRPDSRINQLSAISCQLSAVSSASVAVAQSPVPSPPVESRARESRIPNPESRGALTLHCSSLFFSVISNLVLDRLDKKCQGMLEYGSPQLDLSFSRVPGGPTAKSLKRCPSA